MQSPLERGLVKSNVESYYTMNGNLFRIAQGILSWLLFTKNKRIQGVKGCDWMSAEVPGVIRHT